MMMKHTEKRIGLVDTARLDFHKPEPMIDKPGFKFEVTGQALQDGKVVVLPGQELVIRCHEGKCLIVLRG